MRSSFIISKSWDKTDKFFFKNPRTVKKVILKFPPSYRKVTIN